MPALFGVATKLPDESDDIEVRSDITKLTWLGAGKFALTQRRTLEIKAVDLPQKLGAFGKPDADDDTGRQSTGQAARRFMTFSAAAIGALGSGGSVRIVAIKSGAFD